jgi:hypothetical protein
MKKMFERLLLTTCFPGWVKKVKVGKGEKEAKKSFSSVFIVTLGSKYQVIIGEVAATQSRI